MASVLDPVLNFVKVEVSTGYDIDDTEIVLETDEGAKLPAPATDGAFNLVWWNSTDYPDPSDDPNREIVRCTARTTDTLTVTRGQESLAASTKNTADKVYKMLLALTKKTVDDIAGGLTVADEAADTSCFIVFSAAATGLFAPKTNAALTFNSATGEIGASIYSGIAAANLVDLSAAETITGLWTFPSGTKVQQVGGNLNCYFDFVEYEDNVARCGQFRFRKSHQDTAGYTATIDGEDLGIINAYGVGTDADSFDVACYILFEQDGSAGATQIPGRIGFYTGTNAASPTLKLSISNAGAITLENGATFDGIAAGNIPDLSAAETIAATWTHRALAAESYLIMLDYSDGTDESGSILFRKSHQDTAGYTATVANEDLGKISFYGVGSDADSFDLSAILLAEQDGAAGTTRVPTRFIFLTSPGGTTAPAERLRIDSAGLISVGTGGSIVTADHGTAATDQVVNVCYGTGDPPTASTTTEGTLFIKYTA